MIIERFECERPGRPPGRSADILAVREVMKQACGKTEHFDRGCIRPAATTARGRRRRPGRPRGGVIMVLLAVLAGLSSPAEALLPNNLHGYLRVTGVSSTADSQTTKSLSQEYSVYWSKQLTPWFQTRASLRYQNLGLDQNLGENSWRREYQPTSEVLWTHPDFVVNGLANRRKTTNSTEDGSLITDGVSVTLSTRMIRYPLLRARYEWEHNFSDGAAVARDTRRNNGQGGLTYSIRQHSLAYTFARNRYDDDRGGMQLTETRHQFRWHQTTIFPGRFARVASSYDFGYRAQETEVTGDTTVLFPIPYRTALYALDATPEFGTLDSLPSLADGNTTSPVQPPINIGAGLPDHNLGLDFGYETAVAALYIYTDRPSGPQQSWRVWSSSDNLSWTPLTEPVTVFFNPAFNRYELMFPTIIGRYFKAVNSGANDEPTVLVTELEARERLPQNSRDTRHQTTHRVDLIGTVTLTKTVETSAELAVRRQPRGEFTDSRNQVSSAFSLRHTPWTFALQTIRYQTGYEDFSSGGVRNDHRNLTYTLTVTPLTTLHFSFAAVNRLDYIESVKTQETNNLLFRTTGNLLAGLMLSGETGFSRSNRYDSRRTYDTWTHRAGAEGTLWRPLDFSVSFLYQDSHHRQTDLTFIRRQYTADVNWRLTRTISANGSLTFDDDGRRDYTYQTYGVGWTLTPKILLSGQATVTGGESEVSGDRRSAQLTYLVGPRSSLYVGVADVEYPSAGRTRGTSYQFGLKTGF